MGITAMTIIRDAENREIEKRRLIAEERREREILRRSRVIRRRGLF